MPYKIRKNIIALSLITITFFSCEDDGITPIFGCIDITACNVSANANTDDGSCIYPPTGECDCNGNTNDECGVCGGDGVDVDQDSICDDEDDCVGAYDACNICNGDNTGCDGCDGIPNSGSVEDCLGECGGTAVEDECGICNGTGIPDGDCDCNSNILDCNDECDGGAINDECGVCGGNGSTCPETVNYTSEIQSAIFNQKCTGCHGDSGGLSLTSYQNLMSGDSDDGPVVIPNSSSSSLLWQYVNDGTMPSGEPPLSQSEKNKIADWIDQGANP